MTTRIRKGIAIVGLATALSLLGPPLGNLIVQNGLLPSFSNSEAYASTKSKNRRHASAQGLVIASAKRHGVPVSFALRIARIESGVQCGRIGDKGRSFGPLQIHAPTARAMFGVGYKRLRAMTCAAQLDLGMRHLRAAYRSARGNLCLAAVKHNGGIGARGGHWMTRRYANAVVGGCYKIATKHKRQKKHRNR